MINSHVKAFAIGDKFCTDVGDKSMAGTKSQNTYGNYTYKLFSKSKCK